MKRWNEKQKQLVSESLSNLTVGMVLLGIITPLFTGIKDAILFSILSSLTIVFSLITFLISLKILEK